MTTAFRIPYRYLFSVIFLTGYISSSGFSQTSNTQNIDQTSGLNQNQFSQNGLQNTGSQQQNSGIGSRFGSGSSGQSRLTGRNTSSRSSRRNTGFNGSDPNTAIQTTPDAGRAPTRRTSPPSGMTAPSAGSSNSSISVHTGNSSTAGTTPNNTRAVPKPTIKKKTYIYLESSHLVPNTGEAFTVEVRLSGIANTKFDALGIGLSYDPEWIQPVQGQGKDGEWLTANHISTDAASDRNESQETLSSLLSKSNAATSAVTVNRVNHSEGTIHLSLQTPSPLRAENLLIARITFAALKPVKSTRITLTTQTTQQPEMDAAAIPMTHLLFEGEDVLGSTKDPYDGVIPLDISILSPHGSTESIAWLNDSTSKAKTETTLSLRVDHTNIDVGDLVEMDVILENPAQIPVDDVKFLIVYNSRVLETVSHDTITSTLSAKDSGLFINEEKGILHYQGVIRSTKPDRSMKIATIRFRATHPTTKTTFRVLVSKVKNQLTTGVFFKGQDVLGNSNNPSDGIQTTSLSIRPTLAYMHDLAQRR